MSLTKPKNTSDDSVCVVVARYNERLDWLPCLHEDYAIHISNSGNEIKDVLPIRAVVEDVPNEGREAGHWIRYIVNHYNNLADITVFLQGSPHIGHTGDILFNLERSNLDGDFRYLLSNDIRSRVMEGSLGRTIIQSAVGRKYRIVPQATGGVWGGQHFVRKEVLQSHPIDYYAAILSKAGTPSFAHAIEHSYNCVYGLPPLN